MIQSLESERFLRELGPPGNPPHCILHCLPDGTTVLHSVSSCPSFPFDLTQYVCTINKALFSFACVTLIKMASLCMDLSLNIVSRYACIYVCARGSLISLMYGISFYEYITLCIHPSLHKYELFSVFVLCWGFCLFL